MWWVYVDKMVGVIVGLGVFVGIWVYGMCVWVTVGYQYWLLWSSQGVQGGREQCFFLVEFLTYHGS